MSFTLDDLSEKSFEELEALYRSGKVPASLAVLDNKPKGRMLAVRGIDKTPLSGSFRRPRSFRSSRGTARP